MNSPLTLLAWSAVAAYLSAYYWLLYIRRPKDREYLAFALLTAGLVVYSGGNAFVLDADTLQRAVLGRRISNVGTIMIVAFFIDFQAELRGVKTKLSRVTYAWALIGLIAETLGVFWLDHEIEPWWAYGGREGPMPAMSLAALVHTSGLLVLSVAGVVPLLSRSEGTSRLSAVAVRAVGWAGFLALLAGGHDLLVRAGFLRAYPVFDHVAIVFSLTVSYALLDRFVREGEELQVRTSELAEALEELRDSQRKLVDREQLAAVGELSAVIAHEIRNPLAIIKNASSALRREDTAAGDRSTLRDILDEETERLQRLVHDLLAYSRPVVPQARALRLAELVKRSVERAKSGVQHADDVDVVYVLDEGPEHVHGDPELLRHALVNVVENALEAMQGGGRLEIRASQAELGKKQAVQLAFEDSGEGMDTLVRGRARNPFFTTRPSGTGLGLAIVERVVRNHGGDVSIESMHGRGTTVTLVLPCEAS